MAQIKVELPAIGRDRYCTVTYEPGGSPFGFAFHFLHLGDDEDDVRELVLLETSVRQLAKPEDLDLDNLEALTAPAVRDLADRWDRLASVARAALEQMLGLERGETNFTPAGVRTRREMTPEFLADVVQRHEAYRRQGVAPTQALAREERVSISTVKHWLRKAREEGSGRLASGSLYAPP